MPNTTPYNLKQGLVGHVRSEVQTFTANDSNVRLEGNDTLVINADDTDLTLANIPGIGAYLEIIGLDVGTASTVTLPGSYTFDGTNNIATFDADGERIVCRVISDTRLFVIANPDSVSFSS